MIGAILALFGLALLASAEGQPQAAIGFASVVELWKPITGFEGYYEISSHGRVKSLPRVVRRRSQPPQTVRGQILTPRLNSYGYRTVDLCSTNQRKQVAIHLLVMRAFIPVLQQGLQVNHIDGNKSNNTIQNLEWVTPSQNIQHAYDTGLICKRPVFGEDSPASKLSDLDVLEIRKLYAAMSGHTHRSLAAQFNMSRAQIGRILRNSSRHV